MFSAANAQIYNSNVDRAIDTYAANDRPLEELKIPTDGELLGIYRDALRVYGMWSYRSYPLEQR